MPFIFLYYLKIVEKKCNYKPEEQNLHLLYVHKVLPQLLNLTDE